MFLYPDLNTKGRCALALFPWIFQTTGAATQTCPGWPAPLGAFLMLKPLLPFFADGCGLKGRHDGSVLGTFAPRADRHRDSKGFGDFFPRCAALHGFLVMVLNTGNAVGHHRVRERD